MLFSAKSDILSDMKTFTVRELDRTPGLVLDTCDREGGARIRRRDGRSYTIRPENGLSREVSPADRQHWLEEHLAWLERSFPTPISSQQSDLVDRLIAGE